MAFADEITEKKTIKISQSNCDNPVYLKWINKQGGNSFWLFNRNQLRISKTKNGDIYEKHLSTLIGTYSNRFISTKDADHSIRLTTTIEESDIDGIIGLHESPKVFRLVNPDTWSTEGCKWESVIISPSSLIFLKTNTSRFNVEIDILLPKIYVQSE